MKRVALTKEAQKDLDDIWIFIASESGGIATVERVIWRLHHAILALAKSPGIGRPCSKDVSPNMQWFPVENYIVYYRPEATRLTIIHVFDGLRDQQRARSKTKSATKREQKRAPKH